MKIAYFKNRVSLYNLYGVAVLMLLIFISIYSTVSWSVNYDINETLNREIEIHQSEVSSHNGVIEFVPEGEWKEPEHQTLFINPVYVEIYDANKKLMEKSPNLKNRELLLTGHQGRGNYIDTFIDSIPVRQVQTPLLYEGKTVGYAVIAMSIESENRVLRNLAYNLVVTYPVCLLLLFFLTRFIAARSIRPALEIIETTSHITDSHFNKRIPLPKRNDELFKLAVTINELLDRIENAISREKQFTTDASHELRTPLAIIKGTLEVLLRKPRNTEEYITKIQYCVDEVNRMNNLVDQLLLLARFEKYDKNALFQNTALDEILQEAVERYSSKIEEKELKVIFNVDRHYYVHSDASMLSILIENILSNAIKYSLKSGIIEIKLEHPDGQHTICTISDEGVGIAEKDMKNIYDQFYRSEVSENSRIKGTGLGLSIVKKIAALLNITLDISSKKNVGTTVSMTFKK
jgi:signal transduction histidine kinase